MNKKYFIVLKKKIFIFFNKILIKILSNQFPNKSLIISMHNGFKLTSVLKVLNLSKKQSNNLNYLKHKKFIYVVGLPRTGGAYLTRCLRDNLSPYLKGDYTMANENIPCFSYFDDLKKEKKLLSEFNQILSWTEIFYPNYNLFIKKNSGAGLRPDKLQKFFGESLEHILFTIRKPSEVYNSWCNTNLQFAGFGKQFAFIDRDFRENPLLFLEFYQQYNLKFLTNIDLELKKKVIIVQFGKQNEIIKSLFKKYKKVDNIYLENIQNRSKVVTNNFWNSDVCHKIIDNIEIEFQKAGFNVALK